MVTTQLNGYGNKFAAHRHRNTGAKWPLPPEIFVMGQMYGSATPVVQEAAVEMYEQHCHLLVSVVSGAEARTSKVAEKLNLWHSDCEQFSSLDRTLPLIF